VTRAVGDRIVIGVGNPDRGDDGAGREVARRLRALGGAASVEECDGDVSRLLEHFAGRDEVILIDACVSGAPAGTVRRIDVAQTPLPCGTFGLSSHGVGLAEAVELSRALGQLPRRCIVYAIEGETFEAGAALSPAVARAVGEVVAQARREIASPHSA
jgi:hydrogenase maturation protease